MCGVCVPDCRWPISLPEDIVLSSFSAAFNLTGVQDEHFEVRECQELAACQRPAQYESVLSSPVELHAWHVADMLLENGGPWIPVRRPPVRVNSSPID